MKVIFLKIRNVSIVFFLFAIFFSDTKVMDETIKVLKLLFQTLCFRRPSTLEARIRRRSSVHMTTPPAGRYV